MVPWCGPRSAVSSGGTGAGRVPGLRRRRRGGFASTGLEWMGGAADALSCAEACWSTLQAVSSCKFVCQQLLRARSSRLPTFVLAWLVLLVKTLKVAGLTQL